MVCEQRRCMSAVALVCVISAFLQSVTMMSNVSVV